MRQYNAKIKGGDKLPHPFFTFILYFLQANWNFNNFLIDLSFHELLFFRGLLPLSA